MANIYRYDNLTNTAGIYQHQIGGYRLSINGNVKVKGDLCFYKEGSTTDSYCLQDLIFIKSLEINTLHLSATDKLGFKLKEITSVNKSGLESDINGLYVNFDTNTLELGLDNQLQVKDGVYKKNISITIATSTEITNSTILLSGTNVLTFTEGSLAKSYRDQAEGFKNSADSTQGT